MTKKRLILALVVIVALAAVFLYLRRWLQIDDCLDDGGRWDYAAAVCDR